MRGRLGPDSPCSGWTRDDGAAISQGTRNLGEDVELTEDNMWHDWEN